jgi:hypothetical protein
MRWAPRAEIRERVGRRQASPTLLCLLPAPVLAGLLLVGLLPLGAAQEPEPPAPEPGIGLDVPLPSPSPPRSTEPPGDRPAPVTPLRRGVAVLLILGPAMAQPARPGQPGEGEPPGADPVTRLELAVQALRPYLASLPDTTALALYEVSDTVRTFAPRPPAQEPVASSEEPDVPDESDPAEPRALPAPPAPPAPYVSLSLGVREQVLDHLSQVVREGPGADPVSAPQLGATLREILTTHGVTQVFVVGADLGGLRIRPVTAPTRGGDSAAADSIWSLLTRLPRHQRPRVNVFSVAPRESLTEDQLLLLARGSSGFCRRLP